MRASPGSAFACRATKDLCSTRLVFHAGAAFDYAALVFMTRAAIKLAFRGIYGIPGTTMRA